MSRFDRIPNLWAWAIFVIVVLAVLFPLAFLVLGSFSTARRPSLFTFETLGLVNYVKVWSDPSTYALINNTLIYGVGSTVLALALATLFAWLVERTDVGGKSWIYTGVAMTLAMPSMLQAIAWVLLLSPKIGFINRSLMDLFGLQNAPFNIYGLGGMIFVEGLHLVPTAFLMIAPLLRSIDPSLEEAAGTTGASPLRTFRKVTLRLLLPGLFAVAVYQFMIAIEVFEIPGVLGMPAGTYLLSTKIYILLNPNSFLPNYGEANAIGMIYIVISVLAMIVYSRIIGHSEKYATITGKGFRPRVHALGVWRIPAVSVAVLYIILSVVLPFLVLLYISFTPFLQAPSFQALGNLTLNNYKTLFSTPQIGRTLANTGIMVAVTATATVVFSFLISLAIVRSRFAGRRVLDQLSFLPHGIPGIVMGLALLWVFLKLDMLTGVPLFGTIWTICIAFTITFMAYGTRVMNAAILQIHKDLEEAARVCGSPQWRVMWRVFYPLLLPAFAGIWIWAMLHAVRIAGQPLLLTDGPKNEVLAVTMWSMWNAGHSGALGAVGTLMMLALLPLTLLLRHVGFKRGD